MKYLVKPLVPVYIVNIIIDEYINNIAANKYIEQRNNISKAIRLSDSDIKEYDDIVSSYMMTIHMNGFKTPKFRQASNSYSGYFNVEPNNSDEYPNINTVAIIFRVSDHISNNFDTDEEISEMLKLIQKDNTDSKLAIRKSYIININNINNTIQEMNKLIDDLNQFKSI